MEQKLNELLEENEKVLWMGRPEKSQLLKAPDRRHQIMMWCVLAVFLLGSVALVIPYMVSIGRPVNVIAVAFIVINFVPGLMAFRPMMDQRLLEGKALYAITDRRAIALVKDAVFSLPVAGLEWIVTSRDLDRGSIRFGAAAYAKDQDDRADAVLGVLGVKDERTTTGFVFFHIPQVDAVAKLLRKEERTAA